MGKKRANRKEAYRPPAAEDAPAMKSTVTSRVGIVAIVGYVMLAVLVQVGTQHLVPIHAASDYDGMRATGALAARTLAHVEPHIQPGVTTAALDAIVRDFIADNGATAATLGYRGYKHSSCISVNEVVCHGVPSTEVTLNAGDIVNVDVTTVLDGWYGDTSKTFVVGGEDAASDEARASGAARGGAAGARPDCWPPLLDAAAAGTLCQRGRGMGSVPGSASGRQGALVGPAPVGHRPIAAHRLLVSGGGSPHLGTFPAC